MLEGLKPCKVMKFFEGAAAGEKGVGRDIDDRHNARRGQIRQNVFGFHRVTIYPGGQPRIRAPRDLY